MFTSGVIAHACCLYSGITLVRVNHLLGWRKPERKKAEPYERLWGRGRVRPRLRRRIRPALLMESERVRSPWWAERALTGRRVKGCKSVSREHSSGLQRFPFFIQRALHFGFNVKRWVSVTVEPLLLRKKSFGVFPPTLVAFKHQFRLYNPTDPFVRLVCSHNLWHGSQINHRWVMPDRR